MTAVDFDSRKRRTGGICPEFGQEGLQICGVGELLQITSDTEDVLAGGSGSVGARAVESPQARRSDGGSARAGHGRERREISSSLKSGNLSLEGIVSVVEGGGVRLKE